MPYQNQKWKKEYVDFLFTLTDVKSKQDRLMIFKEKFPESDFTINAIATKMQEVGALKKRNDIISHNHKPLYSEQCKKGYVRIKVAEPGVWWQKSKWVYLETHPWEYNKIQETDAFYFLDGNNRNFDPDNIMLVHRREQVVFQVLGGVVPGHPEQTKQNILQARLKLAQLDLGEKLGLVGNYGGGRKFRDEVNENARAYRKKYNATEKGKKMYDANRKRYMDKLRSDPERYAAYKKRRHEWYKTYREKKKNEIQNL